MTCNSNNLRIKFLTELPKLRKHGVGTKAAKIAASVRIEKFTAAETCPTLLYPAALVGRDWETLRALVQKPQLPLFA